MGSYLDLIHQLGLFPRSSTPWHWRSPAWLVGRGPLLAPRVSQPVSLQAWELSTKRVRKGEASADLQCYLSVQLSPLCHSLLGTDVTLVLLTQAWFRLTPSLSCNLETLQRDHHSSLADLQCLTNHRFVCLVWWSCGRCCYSRLKVTLVPVTISGLEGQVPNFICLTC